LIWSRNNGRNGRKIPRGSEEEGTCREGGKNSSGAILRAQYSIYETENALTVVVEMPGVEKDKIEINIEDNVLKIEGHIDFASYTEMQPVYTEYNIGHYSRKFSLSSKIDQSKISADMKDGVLTLTLPKAEEAKPRKITIR
jgi:HSP20 family protein